MAASGRNGGRVHTNRAPSRPALGASRHAGIHLRARRLGDVGRLLVSPAKAHRLRHVGRRTGGAGPSCRVRRPVVRLRHFRRNKRHPFCRARCPASCRPLIAGVRGRSPRRTSWHLPGLVGSPHRPCRIRRRLRTGWLGFPSANRCRSPRPAGVGTPRRLPGRWCCRDDLGLPLTSPRIRPTSPDSRLAPPECALPRPGSQPHGKSIGGSVGPILEIVMGRFTASASLRIALTSNTNRRRPARHIRDSGCRLRDPSY